MKIDHLIAREGETFMLLTGEYDDARIHGPFVATRDLPGKETAETYATWLAEVGRAGAIEPISKMDANDAFRKARLGPIEYDPTSAALAAWLVHGGAAIPKPCLALKVDTSASSEAFSVMLQSIGDPSDEYVRASTPIESDAPTPGR